MNAARHLDADYSLQALLAGYTGLVADLPISGITLNSQKTQPGDVFFALAGTQYHGLMFAEQAIDKGAVAVVYDPVGASHEVLNNIGSTITIAIPKLAEKIGTIAARFYGYPATQLKVIGITGTNGKTSCSQFFGQTLDDCAVIGTLGSGQLDRLSPSLNTTPDAITLQQILAAMVAQKQSHVAMEVSSHGLVQGRVNGVTFNGAVITNISRDHLDYHGSMSAYLAAKLSLFSMPELQYAVLNLDDDYYQQIAAGIPEQVEIWAVTRSAENAKLTTAKTILAEHIVSTKQGLRFDVVFGQQRLPAKAAVYGEFNVDNLLVVLALLLANGYALNDAIKRLERIRPIPGRMENFHLGEHAPTVFIDYAHTPDALKHVLLSARAYCQQKLWLVFGCGGDRDQGKRALMGNIAECYADRIIITDDNPRSEQPAAIVNDILAGSDHSSCDHSGGNQDAMSKQAITVIHDRQTAIATALQQAGPEDCVVIAGKGHENYQEIAGQRHFFSDRALIKAMILAHREAL